MYVFCMYVCKYVSMYLCKYTYVCCMYGSLYTYACMYLCTCIHTHTHTHTHTHAYTHTCIYLSCAVQVMPLEAEAKAKRAAAAAARARFAVKTPPQLACTSAALRRSEPDATLAPSASSDGARRGYQTLCRAREAALRLAAAATAERRPPKHDRRCVAVTASRGEPSRGADLGGASPVPAKMWVASVPAPYGRDGNGATTSAAATGRALVGMLHAPCQRFNAAASDFRAALEQEAARARSNPPRGAARLGSARLFALGFLCGKSYGRFRRAVSRRWAHICAGTGRTPPTSAPGLRLSLPHLRRDLRGAGRRAVCLFACWGGCRCAAFRSPQLEAAMARAHESPAKAVGRPNALSNSCIVDRPAALSRSCCGPYPAARRFRAHPAA